VAHHRPTGGAEGQMRALFRLGRLDYSLGYYEPFEIVKFVRRFIYKPYVVAGLVSLAGFFWGYLRREKRPVSNKFAQFLRNEQKKMMRQTLDAFRQKIGSSQRKSQPA